MRASKEFKGKNTQAYILAIVFFLAIGVVISLISFGYYVWLQATIKAESNGYLQELTQKAGRDVQKTVDDYFAILDTTENLLQNLHITSIDEMQQQIERQRNSWDFRDLLLISEDGEIFDTNERAVSLPQDDFLRETIVNQKRVISAAQIINGAECILFTIPVSDIMVKDTPICALGITYLLDSFDNILSTQLFDGQAYTNVINTDGTIAIPSSSPSAQSFGYNMIRYLQKESPAKSADIQQMQEHVRAGIQGQLECEFGGKNNYITYYPLNDLNWCLVTVVPVDVAHAKTQSLMSTTLWFCSFIIVLVTILVLLLAMGFFKNKQTLEKLAFVDPVTGGHTLQRFSALAGPWIKQAVPGSYAMVYTNLERFRIFNEQHGRQEGDILLGNISKLVTEELSDGEAICRIVDDHFCILIKCKDAQEAAARFEYWYRAVTTLTDQKTKENPAPQFGVYSISDPNLPLEFMIDRARFALNKVSKVQNGRLQYAFYDEKVHLKEVREKQLEEMMEKSLQNGEFVVHLQPKYSTDGKQIGGAEALVRWKTEQGMIFPDEFIPLFEKNGFIIQIDLFVFEEVCKMLQRWLDEGKKLVPISVNCSRRNFQKEDFLEPYCNIFSKYRIPAEYLELEMTESIVYENTKRLIEIVNQIHAVGFKCSIDDFGSGYSSLNLIKDICVDTLKLDKIFFDLGNGNDDRGRSVVESIITLAKSLSMSTVAEGVELLSQVEMLQEMNCNLIQGYIFAKPMPMQAFEALVFAQEPQQ